MHYVLKNQTQLLRIQIGQDRIAETNAHILHTKISQRIQNSRFQNTQWPKRILPAQFLCSFNSTRHNLRDSKCTTQSLRIFPNSTNFHTLVLVKITSPTQLSRRRNRKFQQHSQVLNEKQINKALCLCMFKLIWPLHFHLGHLKRWSAKIKEQQQSSKYSKNQTCSSLLNL